MRLLHAETLEFKTFHDDELPEYLILSHTWGNEEVSYQEMRFLQQLLALPGHLRSNTALVAAMEAAAGLQANLRGHDSIKRRSGYKKINKTAKQAREERCEYFWIDTCCIDKSSSAELQEAINSMFVWYRRSKFCAVYLEDVKTTPGPFAFGSALRAARWTTRGWTLQELIAPRRLYFFDGYWNLIGWKESDAPSISSVTGIPYYVLETGDLSQASIAQKMSWAAKRQTTRVEDRAYSLMGLFGIHMPMLYGEGDNAFRRLQEELIRTTPDDSVFAWRAKKSSLSRYSGLLAKSPCEFGDSGNVTRGNGVFALSNLGLRLETKVCSLSDADMKQNWDKSMFSCVLDASEKGQKIAFLIRELEPSKHARVAVDTTRSCSAMSAERKTLYFEHTPQIPRLFRSRAMHCFHLRPPKYPTFPILGTISKVRPHDLWDSKQDEILMPQSGFDGYDFNVATEKMHFISLVWLSSFLASVGREISTWAILLGYDLSTGRAWCTILKPNDRPGGWPKPDACTSEWRSAIQEFEGFENCDEKDCASFEELTGFSGGNIRVEVSSGLRHGLISHIVDIYESQ
ncbi:HET-domain-containing protein [Decorospora gaudefroyi]|uniref:HET-domain-containing protein n=1 Tax=Decorospora gaudefroyi TaxID=184978 RepID=A0A6A5K703_9PLEO|nr:HET-domain-containing protein [Decorospora gaudefroyi]